MVYYYTSQVSEQFGILYSAYNPNLHDLKNYFIIEILQSSEIYESFYLFQLNIFSNVFQFYMNK